MRKKQGKNTNGIKKYTAFIPSTVRATQNVGKYTIKKLNYFLRNSVKKAKDASKMLNKKAAKSIRSITRRKYRR